jgi:hypothetical protein
MANENEIVNVTLPGPTQIDQDMEAFIAETQKEFSDLANEALDDVPVQASDSGAPAIPDPAVSGEPAATPEVPAEPKAEDPTERGLDRLVAREVELRSREDKIKGAEAEIEALRSRLRELEPRALSPELLNKIKLSPQDGLRAIGLDPDEIVRTALMEKIGDKATPEIKEMMERTRMQREIESLRAHVLDAERRQAAAAYYNNIESGARKYAGDVTGFSKDAPTVAHVAKSNPERVFHEIMEEITKDAAARSAREPNGDVISYEEAAKRVEGRWSLMKSLFSGPEPTPQAPPAASTPAKTTAEAQTQPKSPPKPTVQPPDRPIAPWLQRSTDLEEGVRAGLDEWRRFETKK